MGFLDCTRFGTFCWGMHSGPTKLGRTLTTGERNKFPQEALVKTGKLLRTGNIESKTSGDST